MRNDTVLVLVVLTALAFDFTNGFHDTGNAMATSIATGALGPRTAVAISGALNFVGAFLSLAVAATIANGLVNTADVTLAVVAAGLAGGIIWNLVTWLFGIPSSSSHALIGGVIGSTIAAAGGSAVLWHGLTSKVVIAAVLSPVIAGLVAAIGTWSLYRITRSLTQAARGHGFRIGQIGSACLVSLAHGTNDAQKTMGVISLALIAHGDISAVHFSVPLWVKLGCALSIAGGTASGGWRIINTMGNRITNVESPQGFAAESSSAAVILASSYYGYPLSTTQVVSGGVLGSGLGKASPVHW
ncbi:MAG: inorganic phosphate transporter, partial [Trebonia sp.]|uniref:inorganic phosphate transporter n=1 Tax=Trebonia sp. TaxID=2767075 RepID=UPI003BB15DCB